LVNGGGAVTAAPLLPASAAALTNGNAGANAVPQAATMPTREERDHAKFLSSLGQEQGIPFHEEGLPIGLDLGVKLRTTPEDQMNYLMTIAGKKGYGVRVNQRGEPVVRIDGEDYPVDPHQWTLRTLDTFAASIPEVLATGLAIRAGKPLNPGLL